jgi:Domain of unknown function (DUF4190)
VRTCPFCREEIQASASRCRWCHADLLPPAPPLAPAGAEPSPAQRVRSEDNGLAVTALILGIAGFVLPILAPFALWLGLNAHNNALNPAHPSFGRGKGMAIAGAVLGGIMTAILAVAFLIVINA